MTYKDTTFCTRHCSNLECHRNTGREDFQPAADAWVAYSGFSSCEHYKEPEEIREEKAENEVLS